MYETLIPSPDTLPVHWMWFEILLIFTFFIHMILMNFIVGGSLLTTWDLFRGKLETKASKSIPTLIALTINFGIPPLLFVQVLYGHFFYTSSVILAVPWILVIPILILAYYAAYVFTKNMERYRLVSRIGLIISSIFLLYIAFMFVNNSTLSVRPERWNLYFLDPAGNNFNWGEPTLWPRFLHFIFAAIAIGALGRAVFYRFSNIDEKDKSFQVERNLKIFGWITLLQFVIGTWFWLSMPGPVWRQFMGENLAGTILMFLGWLGAILILFAAFKGRFGLAMIFGIHQVLVMVLIRDISRRAYLQDVFHPSELDYVREVLPLLAFLIVFIIGIAIIFYMFRLRNNTKAS